MFNGQQTQFHGLFYWRRQVGVYTELDIRGDYTMLYIGKVKFGGQGGSLQLACPIIAVVWFAWIAVRYTMSSYMAHW